MVTPQIMNAHNAQHTVQTVFLLHSVQVVYQDQDISTVYKFKAVLKIVLQELTRIYQIINA